ncbi:tripartite motif-containing protein 2-like [Lingula anatina]|uniref:Tripartite motif-containing protein 2-like n=1 Tax=Lingula anatina TaxID=7574 RepID=A0A1S3K8Q0_LINAN|nr:tripartite motif-containing protein 2-like [Lingula anatina]|eukprot:XP_013418626.1 tripartite motif-containing protein 2-like [Lingula anatina]
MAQALAAAFTNKLLTCSICLGEYEDPRVLPCYHTFCYGCICDHATQNMTPKRTFLCPLCREEIQFPREGLGKLKKDFRIHTTRELLSQQQQHEVPSTIKETDVQEVTHGTKCDKHPSNEQKYYCEDDDIVVCGDCALTDHYRHGIVQIKEAVNTNRNKIKTVLVKTLPKLDMFKEAVAKEIASEIQESQIRADSINKIKEQAQRIRRFVDQKEQILISEVNSAYDIRKKQEGTNKDTLELNHASLQSACNFAQELITIGSASDIMIHTKALTERLTVMEKMPVLTPDIPPQITYSPGDISTPGLEAMLGEVIEQSQPPRPSRLEENLPNPRPAPHLPVFLEKAECVHSFHPKLKDDKSMFVTGLAIDEQHMFIVDNSNKRTKVFTHVGQFKFDIKFNRPFDVAVSQTGHLYITSHGEKCVKVYSTKGSASDNDGSGSTVEAMWYHSEQTRSYIDWFTHCVHVLSPTGDQLYHYGGTEGSGVGQLRSPQGVCTDSYGHIFFADMGNHRIVALSPQGQFIRYFDGLVYPIAVAINPFGQLVVAEVEGKVKTFQYFQ